MTIKFEKLKARLLANPKVKAEYDALAPEFEIAAELLRARLRVGLSQAELAARMGTSQSTSRGLKTARRFRAPRRSCATQKPPAANSACGYRRPDASANMARMKRGNIQRLDLQVPHIAALIRRPISRAENLKRPARTVVGQLFFEKA